MILPREKNLRSLIFSCLTTDYLGAISKYLIGELSKQPFFDGPFLEGCTTEAGKLSQLEYHTRWIDDHL